MITGIIAGLLAILNVKIAISTIGARRKAQIAYLGGEDRYLSAHVSAHSNLNAYAPMFLILLFIAETQLHIPWPIVMALGIVFVCARVLHFTGLTKDEHRKKPSFSKRKLGMHLTLWPTLAIALICIGYGLFYFSKRF